MLFLRILAVIKGILRPFPSNWFLSKLIKGCEIDKSIGSAFYQEQNHTFGQANSTYFQHHQQFLSHPGSPIFFLYFSCKLTTWKVIHKSNISKWEATGFENSLFFCCQPGNFLKVKCFLPNRLQIFLTLIPNNHSFVRDSKDERREWEKMMSKRRVYSSSGRDIFWDWLWTLRGFWELGGFTVSEKCLAIWRISF